MRLSTDIDYIRYKLFFQLFLSIFDIPYFPMEAILYSACTLFIMSAWLLYLEKSFHIYCLEDNLN